MGVHVNVPCTSYRIYCDVVKISAIFYYVTCCYAAEISGIVYYVTCCYAAEISGMHMMFTWICYKSIDFASTFLTQIQLSKLIGRAFYIVNYR